MTKAGWGQRLREAREKLGKRNLLTFSAQVGSNRTSWAKFEDEAVAPPFDILIRVSRLTDVSLDWLATGREPMSPALDLDILRAVIEAIEQETPEINPQAKAKLISRLYSDRIKAHSLGIEADSARKRSDAS